MRDSRVRAEHTRDAIVPRDTAALWREWHGAEQLVEDGGVEFSRVADVHVERCGTGVELGCQSTHRHPLQSLRAKQANGLLRDAPSGSAPAWRGVRGGCDGERWLPCRQYNEHVRYDQVRYERVRNDFAQPREQDYYTNACSSTDGVALPTQLATEHEACWSNPGVHRHRTAANGVSTSTRHNSTRSPTARDPSS